MLWIHRSRKRRPDILRKLNEQRVDLLERSRRLLPEFNCRDFLRDREEGRELQRLLRGADLGAVVRDVGGELRGRGGDKLVNSVEEQDSEGDEP